MQVHYKWNEDSVTFIESTDDRLTIHKSVVSADTRTPELLSLSRLVESSDGNRMSRVTTRRRGSPVMRASSAALANGKSGGAT